MKNNLEISKKLSENGFFVVGNSKNNDKLYVLSEVYNSDNMNEKLGEKILNSLDPKYSFVGYDDLGLAYCIKRCADVNVESELSNNLDNKKEIRFLANFFDKCDIFVCEREEIDDVCPDDEVLLIYAKVYEKNVRYMEITRSNLTLGEWINGAFDLFTFEIFLDGSGIVDILCDDGAFIGGLEF